MTSAPSTLPSKIGFNSSLPTANFSFLSNTTVSNPIGQQAQVQSSSANDTLAGVGIQKVLITYFNTNWVLKTEVVNMNGILPVLTVATDILRIEDFETFQVGTEQFAAGNITLTNIGATSTFAQIDLGQTRFMIALHFVAPGKTATMTDLTVNVPTSSGVFFLIIITKDNTPSGGNTILFPENGFTVASNSLVIPLSYNILRSGTFPIVCDARNSIVGLQMGILTRGLAASQIAMASFHYLEVYNFRNNRTVADCYIIK